MKQLFFILVLLIFVPNLANASTLYACTSGGTFSGNIWTATTLDQATCAAGAGPGTTNDLVLNSASGNITIAGVAAANNFDMTGYASTLTINTNQTFTVSGNTTLGGTVAGLGTLSIASTSTFTSNSVALPVTFTISNGVTLTLVGDLTVTGIWRIANHTNITLAGAYNISVGTLNIYPQASTTVLTLVSGQTLTVTTALNILGTPQGSGTIQSSIASSATTLKYTGTPSNMFVSYFNFTDVNATGSSMAIFVYNSTGLPITLTRTTNMIKVTTANIGGIMI